MKEPENGLLVVVTDGPEHLIGKTGYWNLEKTVFGRQDLFDLFGDFHGLDRISREHLLLKKIGSPGKLEIVDNNSAHGSKIEVHPYKSRVQERNIYGWCEMWVAELSSVLKITIGEGFHLHCWGGSAIENPCQYCNMPLESGNVCEVCIRAKPVNSVVIDRDYWGDELVASLGLVGQHDDVPDGMIYRPGLKLVRGSSEFEITVPELMKIADLLQNEFSYHPRMCREYHDHT